jgi:hypothetical protein
MLSALGMENTFGEPAAMVCHSSLRRLPFLSKAAQQHDYTIETSQPKGKEARRNALPLLKLVRRALRYGA